MGLKSFLATLVIFILVICQVNAQMQEQRFMQVLPLTASSTGSTITVKDAVDVNLYAEKSYSVLVKMVYGKEGRSDIKTRSFNYILDYKLNFLNQAGQTSTTSQAGNQLVVIFNGSDGSNTEAYQSLPIPVDANNWSGTTLTVTNAYTAYPTTMPSDFRLELHLICTYRLKPNTIPFLGNLSYNGPTKEFSWPYQRAATTYQLEWVFIDNETVYSPSPTLPADYFLLKEPVRVMLKEQYFHFEPKYAAGRVYARVRAVWQYGGEANQQPHFCDWQYLSSPTQINIVNTTPGTNEIQSFEVTKNWQYTAQYAEGGKSSQAINFYDGSLRSRQNIALMNSENIEVVSETLYDNEGRPVINIMPYPVAATSMNYRFRDNVFQGEGTVPNKSIYDQAFISASSTALDTLSGAANYYSSSNTILSARNTINAAYIPRSKGYAYAQVQYLQDGTGRPLRQNMPGEAFVMNASGGNFTSYYYDQAKPMEIQRLFGKNVGNSQHYEKRYVVDNNGQISVSYLDQFGKVVATALAGDAPLKGGTAILSAIAGNTAAPITVALNGQNTFDATTNALTSVNSQMNMKTGTQYTMHYDFKGAIDNATAAFPTCNACSYNLEIVVTDPDGLQFSKSTFKNLTAASLNCAATTFSKTVIFNPLTGVADTVLVFNKIGAYKITKKLTLNKESMDVLVASIASSPLAPNLAAIQASYRAAVDYSTCDLTCRDRALSANPTWDPLSPSYVYNTTNEASIAQWIKDNNCDNITAIIDQIQVDNPCASLLTLMTDELPSLGKTDVTQHPEYCHYTACMREAASTTYDLKMASVKNWTDAVAAGYHNPLTNMSAQTSPYGSAQNLDPLFDVTKQPQFGSAGVFKTKLDLMKTSPTYSCLTNYLNSGKTLWQYVNDPTTYPLGGATAFNALSVAEQDAQKWRAFCGAYQGLKQQVIYELKTTTGNAWSCAYRDFEYSIVSDPFLVKDAATVNAKIDGLQASSCGSLCDQNAALWVNNLIDNGCISLTELEKTSVILSLKNYCIANCGAANPWGLLIAEHITEVRAGLNINTKPGYQYLKNALQILDSKSSCDLLNISYTNPYSYGSSSAATSLIPTAFAYELINATNKLLEEARNKTNLITTCPDNTSNLFVNNAYSINFGSAGYYYQYNVLIADPVLAEFPPFGPSSSPRFVSFVNDEALKISPYYVPATANALKPYAFSTFEYNGLYNNGQYTNLYPCYSGCQYANNDAGKGATRMDAAYYFVSYTGGVYNKIPKNNIYSISSNPRYKLMPAYSYLRWDGTTYLNETEFIEVDAVLIDGVGNKYASVIYLPRFGYGAIELFNIVIDACDQAALLFNADRAPIIKSNPVSTSTPVTGLTTCTDATQPLTGPNTFCGTTPTVNLQTLRQQCRTEQLAAADDLAQQQYQEALTLFTTNFLTTHVQKCFSNSVTENFTLQYSNKEYQYTLYYYDQAGNLVATVPPEGVDVLPATSFTNGILKTTAADPVHTLQTFYKYNSVGQLISQQSPDGGVSNFFYDSKGQLRLSQNAKQLAASTPTSNIYSYSKYDALARPIEGGEVINLDKEYTYFTSLTTKKDALALLDNATYPIGNSYKDVTQTIFDIGTGQNLRSRVASSLTLNNGTTANTRTTYSYDVHGNVKKLIQEPVLNQPKVIDYCYDLISGVVKRMDYQRGKDEQYAIKYTYDANNRLRNAYSSFDNGLSWKEDAEYFYYLHGPLARIEYGQDKVQGMDYAYTLQGWIKEANTPHERTALSSMNYKNTQDIGNDGIGSGTNRYVAQDEFAYALGYYKNDYSAIGATASLGLAKTAPTAMAAQIAGPGLYNGNITWQIIQLNRLAEKSNSINENTGIRAAAYKYDQLNRLLEANNFKMSVLVPAATPAATLVTDANWKAKYTYDKNGNIVTAVVAGNNGSAMDNLGYNYSKDGNGKLIHNRLNSATESGTAIAADATFSTDINSGQGSNNYTYDAIGNLVGDVSEGTTIEWTATGKVRKVTKTGSVLDFDYDAMGNRVSKKVTTGGVVSTTIYVRDASGNVITTHASKSNTTTLDIDYNLYGSTRLGRCTGKSFTKGQESMDKPNITVYNYLPGTYQYELSNHLGNVHAVVSGLKLGEDTNADNVADHYKASVISLTDYYSFGMTMPGRTYINANAYRYGFNGKEKDTEGMGGGSSTYDYGFRIYNPALGKFLSVDPLMISFPWYAPYQFAGNKPIHCIDIDGLEEGWGASLWDAATSGYNSAVKTVSSNYTAAVTTVKTNYTAAVTTVKTNYTAAVNTTTQKVEQAKTYVKQNYPETYNFVANTTVSLSYKTDVSVGLAVGASIKNPTGIYGVKANLISTNVVSYTEIANINSTGVTTTSSENIIWKDTYKPETTSEIEGGLLVGGGAQYTHQTQTTEVKAMVGPVFIKDVITPNNPDSFSVGAEGGFYLGLIFGFDLEIAFSISNPGITEVPPPTVISE